MAYLAYKLLMARKKWLLLMIASFAIVIASVISIFSSSETIKIKLKQTTFDQYGQFSGVWLNQSRNNSTSSSFGEFVVIDSFHTQGKRKATVGWVDERYMEIGRLSLQFGRLPVSVDEVAIESYYLKQIDSKWKIGTSKELRIGDKTKKFILTGILENYSAGWSVGAREIEFPNLFVSNSWVNEQLPSHFLIPYDTRINVTANYDNAYKIISSNGGSGFLNDRLVNNGLKNLDSITKMSLSLQAVILIISMLSIITMLSFFNSNQFSKFAILKTVGGRDKHLYLLSTLQTSYVFFMGVLLSIPLILVFQSLMVRGSYINSTMNYQDLLPILRGGVIWFIVLYCFIVASSLYSNKANKNKSIKQNLESGSTQSIDRADEWISGVKFFRLKQLLRQLFLYPKHTLFSILTMSMSITVILFALTFAKEAAGVWTTEIDYYLSAQEDIYTKIVDRHTVLVSKDLTYSASDVDNLENLKGIEWIEKVPSMTDVMTIINREDANTTLLALIESTTNQKANAFGEKVIIPNVKYVLKTNEEWSQYEETNAINEEVPFIVLYWPDLQSEEKEKLTEKTLTLSKTILDETDNLSNKKWDFRIAEVFAKPYQETRDEITIVLNEQYVLQEGIAKGYKDLSIYTMEQLSSEESQYVYDNVFALATGTPGGIFQYIPDVIRNTSQIPNLLVRLGNMTFYVAMGLCMTCIYIVIYGKYQLHRRYWGIYRSLGMRLNSIYFCMLMEVLFYFTVSSIVSATLYVVFLSMNRMSYSMNIYYCMLVLTILAVLLLLICGSWFMKRKIGSDSIAKLIKIEE